MLKEHLEKRLEKLETEIKKCSGDVPKDEIFKAGATGRSASFGSRTVKLLKGYPVPKEVSDFIKSKGHFNYYFK